MADDWWKGKAHDQCTHARINASNYPGTRQLCCECDQPTERCEDDSIFVGDTGPLCADCGNMLDQQIEGQQADERREREAEEMALHYQNHPHG